MTSCFALTRYFALAHRTAGALVLLLVVSAAPAQAAARIQHLISPGGIEAWFVQDATVPLIAMEYAFTGGAAQDPNDKQGVANMVASLIDEGSGDLDSRSFHERLDRRAIDLSFSATRDYFRGSLRMLRDNKDEAFELLHLALTSPHFDKADVERIEAEIVASAQCHIGAARRRGERRQGEPAVADRDGAAEIRNVEPAIAERAAHEAPRRV